MFRDTVRPSANIVIVFDSFAGEEHTLQMSNLCASIPEEIQSLGSLPHSHRPPTLQMSHMQRGLPAEARLAAPHQEHAQQAVLGVQRACRRERHGRTLPRGTPQQAVQGQQSELQVRSHGNHFKNNVLDDREHINDNTL